MKEQELVIQRQLVVSETELSQAGYIKPADNEQIVKKVVLTNEEAKLVEKYKDLPFFDYNYNSNTFSREVFNKSREYLGDWGKYNDVVNRLSQAYFTGYTIKEKKYYIKLDSKDSNPPHVSRHTKNWHLVVYKY